MASASPLPVTNEWPQAPLPPDEAHRLRAIDRYKLGGIGREAAFDRVTQLAADLFDVPVEVSAPGAIVTVEK